MLDEQKASEWVKNSGLVAFLSHQICDLENILPVPKSCFVSDKTLYSMSNSNVLSFIRLLLLKRNFFWEAEKEKERRVSFLKGGGSSRGLHDFKKGY